MQVILLQDVKALGKKGEMVKVSEGYARNYLIPKNLAQPANAGNINNMKTQMAAKDFHKAEEKAAAEALKAKLDGATVTFSLKAGAGGKMFGSVTAKEISDELKRLFSTEIDKKKINLPVAIKSFGEYTAEIKLYPEVAAKIKVFAKEQE